MLAGDLRDTGFIAREWNWPSAERVVSIAVFVDLIISLRPMILRVKHCRRSILKNITVYLLLQSVLIVLRLRRVRIQRGGHRGVGIRCKTNFKTLYVSLIHQRQWPNDVIIAFWRLLQIFRNSLSRTLETAVWRGGRAMEIRWIHRTW